MSEKVSKNIRVAVVDNHSIVCQGIASILHQEPNINVITHTNNGASLLNKLRTEIIDVIIASLDIPTMEGLELLKKVSTRYPSLKVIILCIQDSESLIIDCIRHGARSFISKKEDSSKLIEAINAVHRKGYFYDEHISKALVHNMNESDLKEPISNVRLTKRELEIIQLICEGNSNKEIATKLFVSIRTVEVHRKNITTKTKVTNTAGVVVYAIKNGIYKI